MHTSQLLSALLAAGLVSAQTCTSDIKITEPTPSINCDVVNGDIEVDGDVAGDLVIEGPKQIKGNLIVTNVTGLNSLSSSSINSISKTFSLVGLELLTGLRMDSLTNVGEIRFVHLQRLETLTFGSQGVTKIDKIEISDTRLNDLSGLNVATVEDFFINNNIRLTAFNSDLVNITGDSGLVIENNGNNMELELNELEKATELQFGSIKSVKAPALAKVSKSVKFDRNPELTTFAAPNLTEVGEALAFINNRKLGNVSLPKLESIGGDLSIVNNTAMDGIAGLPKLESVGGGIRLGGNFEEVKLPELSDVRGSVNVSSTTDISDFCEFFDNAKDDGNIRGEEECTSNNDKALEGEGGGDSNDGSSGGSGSDSDNSSDNSDDDDAAGIVNVNMGVLALAVVFGIAQLL